MNERILRYRLAQGLVFLTLALLFVGGLVTSTGSGLSVPDWPLSYGKFFPPMVGGIRFEHTHRLAAASVGILTLVLTLWTGVKEPRPAIRRLAIAAWGAVVLQGILGGLTVLFLLPAAVSILHACIGPVFFYLTLALAILTNPANPSGMAMTNDNQAKRFKGLCVGLSHLVFVQILLGAVVRHTQHGIWFHVVSACLVFLMTGFLVTRTLNQFGSEKTLTAPALFLGFLVTVEFFLGLGTFVLKRISEPTHPSLTAVIFPTFHQTLGALILGMTVLLTLRLRQTTPAVLR